MLLGMQLRGLRERAGITREQAGYEIRGSESKISRMELGRVSFKERDVGDLLTLYGVTETKERGRLLELAREANALGWWHRYSNISPTWFQPYLGLESAASMIRTYEVQFVPGLLQTRDYSRAVIRVGFGKTHPDEVERRVEMRTDRQKILTKDNPPLVWVLLDEAVLRRPIGGKSVLRGQVQALLDATELPNVRLQMVPFEAGGHAATGGAFTILRFPDPELSDVVYVEVLTSALYLDKREDIDIYQEAMSRLVVEAEEPQKSRDYLIQRLKELDS
jgi:hypothetical protein